MTATKDALDLPRVPRVRTFSLDDDIDCPPAQLLDSDGACRTGKQIGSANGLCVILDEHTRQVFIAHGSEYRHNVQKDADGNPIQ